MRIKALTRTEILKSASYLQPGYGFVSQYILGSMFEGTSTPGLKSDVDTVMLWDALPVATNMVEAQQYMHCLLLVQDSYTPAGYCKLQLVTTGVPLHRSLLNLAEAVIGSKLQCPLSASYSGDRLVMTVPHHIFSGTVNTQRHGPADTMKGTLISTDWDLVNAVRSCTWPDCASEWLERERHYNWPSREQIDKCKTLGCFFVHVGHPNSAENHLEWRLSFSLQERLLVTDFNSVQLKCYILLKMIKNEMIHKPLGEKSLTSYHFKTCLLYMIENTPAEFWTEENLLVCLHRCIWHMLMCVETGECPNYFIPEENMFDARIPGQLQTRICKILRQILSADFRFLLYIKTDMLGMKYKEALESGVTASRYGQDAYIHLLNPCYTFYNTLLSLRNKVFDKCLNKSTEVFAQKLCEEIQRHQGSNSVGHSVTETREALSLLSPYCDITLMSLHIVEAMRMSASNEVILNRLANERWHAVSLEADPFSAKLKQASAMCMLAYCDLSLKILLGLQDQLEQQISVCGCYGAQFTVPRVMKNSLPAISECSYDELLHRHFLPCVVYLPAERDLTPPALCYEMDRSVGSLSEDKLHWHEWAVVDGRILFYFLMYLNHHHLGMEENALADIEVIKNVFESGSQVNHPDTACNILGWIFKERGLTALAESYFRLSLTAFPTHNAASLHLQELRSTL